MCCRQEVDKRYQGALSCDNSVFDERQLLATSGHNPTGNSIKTINIQILRK
jgi:hypothetical protein